MSKIKVFQPEGNPHDDATIEQLETCACAGDAPVAAICADGHLGYSAPIGSAVAYEEHLSPSGVGFDIACGNKVQGNLIGVKKDGTSALGGVRGGVDISSPKNTVGGAQPGEANVIANTFEQGVRVRSNLNDGDFNTGNRILGNSVFGNGS